MDAVGQFLLSPLDLGLELVADLHPVLDEILEPIADRLQVLERQPGQRRLNLLYAAHGHTIAQRYGRFKPRPGVEDCGTGRKLVETGHDGSLTFTRDPNSPIRVRGLSGPNEVSLHPSSLKESPVQAWFDATGQFIILETPGQRAQVWDAATGLPVTPIFQSRYATSEAEYRTVALHQSPILNPQFSIPNRPPISALRLQSELLAGSRLDGTGGWKPLELGEIVARWNERGGRTPTSSNRPKE